MNSDTIVLTGEQEELLEQLARSRACILTLVQEGRLDQAKLRGAADAETTLTLLLHPMPVDPSEHVLAAHSHVHPYLEHLIQHDPAHVVLADEEHSYTPRKILRRVLDHALDHLNQIEQWLAWQQDSIVPVPADGWASSAETLQEDVQPLSPAELQAWLWRVDIAVSMVAQRARRLSAEQLDWIPPDGGWTLRHALHHLALAEVFYAVWLDEPLPDEASARYSEANRRFEQQLWQAFVLPEEKQMAFFNDAGDSTITAEQVARMVLANEQMILDG